MKKAIIVEPEIPENTGFIARLAANFGFDLRMVNPGFNLSEARQTASNAQRKLREAEIFDSVEEAVEDLDYVVGTKPGRGPEVSDFESRENTSVMIGRESSGLSSGELELCDAVVHVDTGSYSSINQSHAAAILFHSMREPDGRGVSMDQKRVIENLLPEKTFETLMEANPSREKIEAILGEIKSDS
ncbi:MAG: RNA methyltransferase [Candidatus Nanohaloarchaea archaeon]